MSTSESRSAIVLELAEEFLDRYRKGQRPPLKDYIDRHPELADEIREVFPAMALMEHIAIADDYPAGEVTGGHHRTPAISFEQLGDYRILREVGRGGMGVVYEAEQVSLGRHVALKVLTAPMVRDATHRRRFEREAKAAAKLHHTNIVPVFGVGEHEGTPYYVMQFIQGLGLDLVLDELRRLRAGERPVPVATAAEPVEVARRDVTAADVARSLMTGRLAVGGREDSDRDGVPALPATVPLGPGTSSESVPPSASVGSAGSTSASPSSASILARGQCVEGRASARQSTYWDGVARIGAQAADALAHAHQQGVLHRDIKPSNLLLDTRGTVWVTDFGLAKADDQQDLTHTGDVLGTLRYMPPEAFEGRPDVRGDVYSLGLTLYELLALRPAFDEKERNRLIRQVTTSEPARLDRANPAVPRDLVTIVHKAIDKDPARRYQAVSELAADLQRYLDDEPIQARRLGLRERGWRWCRRNPAVAGLAAALALLLVGATAASILAAAHFERTAANERTARRQADDARHRAEGARRSRERMLTDMYTSFGLAAGARDDPRQAVLWFAYAARLAGDDRERADANRIRAAAWGRNAIQPVRAFVHPREWVENNMAFHPGGGHLLTCGDDPTTGETDCRLWDLEREAALPFPGNPIVVSAAAWDATGERLAVGTAQGEVTIYHFSSGEVLQRVPYAGRSTRVLFSPDGRYCALAAGNRVRVWDCRRAAFATPELEHPATVTALVFHPRGELLATGCKDSSCRVFDLAAEQRTPLFAPVPHRWSDNRSPIPPIFADGGRGLLTANVGSVSWRDPRTGQPLRDQPFGEPGRVFALRAITLGGDGKHLALAGGYAGTHRVRIYDVASARPVSPYLDHRQWGVVWSIAFSPDGKTLLTGASDNRARLWSVPAGRPLGGPLGHSTSVSGVAFAPDGRHLATAQRGGLIRLWALPAGNPRDYRVPVGRYSFVRLSRDGRFLLPTGLNSPRGDLRQTQLIDLATGRRTGQPLGMNGSLLDAALSPDGLQMAAAVSGAASPRDRTNQPGRQPGQVQLWDWRAGKLQHDPLPFPAEPRKMDYSPDGRQLAVIGADGGLVVIDPVAGRTLRRWQANPQFGFGSTINNGAVRFSPDGRLLLTFSTDTNSARVWDPLTGELRHELKHKGMCQDVQFSPDGRLVSTAGYDNRVCVWELATGQQLACLLHPDWTFTAPFSPDGKHLLTACRDGMARLWDWRAGRLVCPSFEHEHEVHAVAFTPDRRHVVSASDDGVLKIWEWLTGRPVCPPLALGGAGLSLAVTPDGRRVACGGFMNELTVFQLDEWLTPAALAPDDLCVWGEVVSGQRVEDGGGVTNLTAEEWLQRWQGFRRRHPEKAAMR